MKIYKLQYWYKIQCVNAKYVELVEFTRYSLYFLNNTILCMS